MSSYYGRKCTLQVGTRLFTDLRIAFKVKRTLEANPHPAEIQIYNLGSDSRQAFQEKGVQLVLAAGYKESFGQIWSGQLRTVSHVKHGPDWITKVEGGDGEKLRRTSRVSKSYKAGTPITTVIQDVAKATGYSLGNLQQQLANIAPGSITQFTYGTAIAGVAADKLYDLLQIVGLNYSVQDGALQVLSDGSAISNGNIFLLSPSSGLVDSPEIGEESTQAAPGQAKTAGKRHVLKVESLLNHQLVPGGQVQINSNAFKNSVYKIEKLEHKGDTHGGDKSWITSLECRL